MHGRCRKNFTRLEMQRGVRRDAPERPSDYTTLGQPADGLPIG